MRAVRADRDLAAFANAPAGLNREQRAGFYEMPEP
jgi:hypothetical protein